MLTPAEIAGIAARALDDKKARDVKILKTAEQTVIADYFVICNGTPPPSGRLWTRSATGPPKPANRRYAARVCAPTSGCSWTSAALSFTCLPTRRASSITLSAFGATLRKCLSHPFRALRLSNKVLGCEGGNGL